MKRNAPLKRGKPLKKGNPLKKSSTKGARIKREYTDNFQKKLEDFDGVCEGCDRPEPCTPSHYIPRGFDASLTSDPDNFGFQCQKCAALCELGDYPALLCGKRIYDYVAKTRPLYIRIKELSYLERTGKEMITQFK